MREPEPRHLYSAGMQSLRIGTINPKHFLAAGSAFAFGVFFGLTSRDALNIDSAVPTPPTPQHQYYDPTDESPTPIYIATIAANTISSNATMVTDSYNALHPTKIYDPIPTPDLSTSTPLPTITVCETPRAGEACTRPTAVPTPTALPPDCNDTLETPTTLLNQKCIWPTKVPAKPVPIGNPPNI